MLNGWIDHKCLWRIDRVETVDSWGEPSVTVWVYHAIEDGGLGGEEGREEKKKEGEEKGGKKGGRRKGKEERREGGGRKRSRV